ncbi:MAG: hypothetical protein LH477_13785 [Nocardioides sp.]|nr:hypothetical protein [Nocardioides sp.]
MTRFNDARGLERINFEEYSPRQLLAEATIAVYGTVESVRDGRTYNPGGLGMRNVVVGVKATEVLKDDSTRQGDLVYFEMSRRDDSTIDAIENALPEGTHVALFAYPASDPGFQVDGDPDAGREPGSSVYFPLVQGLWIQTPDGLDCVLDPDITDQDGWTGINAWPELATATQAS